MKSAIAALALGAAGASAFVTPNAVVGRVAARQSSRKVHVCYDMEGSTAVHPLFIESRHAHHARS